MSERAAEDSPGMSMPVPSQSASPSPSATTVTTPVTAAGTGRAHADNDDGGAGSDTNIGGGHCEGTGISSSSHLESMDSNVVSAYFLYYAKLSSQANMLQDTGTYIHTYIYTYVYRYPSQYSLLTHSL